MTYPNTQLFINGEWQDAQEGRTLAVHNPATGKEETLSVRSEVRWVDLLARLDDELAFMDDWGNLILWHHRTGQARLALNIEREEYALTALQRLADGRLVLGMGNGANQLWRPA